MPKLRCSGCKGNLIPADANVEIITCMYCRATNKNPDFLASPEPVLPESPPINNQSFNQEDNQNMQPSKEQQARSTQLPNDEEFLPPASAPSFETGSGSKRRRGRQIENRRRGCSCFGCFGCFGIFVFTILVLLAIALLIAFIFRAEILDIILDIIYDLTGFRLEL